VARLDRRGREGPRLVDELGGYATALKLAKEAAKDPGGEKVKVAVFRRKRAVRGARREALGRGGGRESFTALVRLLEPIRPVLRQVEAERQGS